MAETNIAVVDGHMHLWDLDNHLYSWLNGPDRVELHMAGPLDPIRKNYLLREYQDDCKNQNVIKCVHVQAEHSDHLREAHFIQGLHERHGMPNGQVCGVRFEEPHEKVQALLSEYAKLSTVRGVRELLNWHDTDPSKRFTDRPRLLLDPNWQQNYALLERFHFSFDLHIYPWQAEEAVEVLRKHPNIPVIIDHTLIDYVRTAESFQSWKRAAETLAHFPQTHMKLSGSGNFMLRPGWTEDQFAPYILAAIQVFGVDRCFFASNFPVDKLAGSYDHLFDTFKNTVKNFSADDKKKLFQTNCERVYRV